MYSLFSEINVLLLLLTITLVNKDWSQALKPLKLRKTCKNMGNKVAYAHRTEGDGPSLPHYC